MSFHITLTDDQTRVLRQAFMPVEVRDAKGNVLAVIEPEQNSEFIAEMKRRAKSTGPWYTTDQVAGHFKALEEEWERTGGFDEAYMQSFLTNLRKAEQS